MRPSVTARGQISQTCFGGEVLDVDADRLGDAGVLAVLVHPVRRHGEAYVADGAQTHVVAGLLGEPAVEIHRVLVNLAHRVAHVEQRQQAGGVPGRPGRQFLALQQHHVRPALGRQVIERRDADDAAADDHDSRMLRHLPFPVDAWRPEPAPHLFPGRAIHVRRAAARACGPVPTPSAYRRRSGSSPECIAHTSVQVCSRKA